jgi:2-alkyl-3-oxoalkanoate reductase
MAARADASRARERFMAQRPQRILITGASGFIGGHVAEALSQRGAAVRALVRPSSDVRHLRAAGVELATGHLGDVASLARACEGMDMVIHGAAAVGSFGEWDHFYETGVLGTERLIDAAHEKGVRRFIHLSSIAVYGLKAHHGPVDEDTPFDRAPQPWNHYVREKVMAEDILWRAHADKRIQATAIRPSVVVGARDRNAVPRLVELLRLPVTVLPGQPSFRFPAVTIEDCVSAVVRAVENEAAVGRAYNVSGEKAITAAEFFGHVARHAHLPAPKIYLPTAALIPAVGLLEGAWKLLRRPNEPVATRIAIVVSGYDYEIDCRRAQRELGFRGQGDYGAAIGAAIEQPNAVRPGTLVTA